MKSVRGVINQTKLDRIEAYHRGEIQKPQWLVDWERKLADTRMSLAVADHQGLLTSDQKDRYMDAVVRMMRRRDRLYDIWLDELPFKTWGELAAECPPSADDLFRYTIEDTEDHLNGPGVSAFVLFLEQKWTGFFKDFVYQCLQECDPLIEESVLMTKEIRRTVSYPQQTFNTSNSEVLEDRLLAWARKIIPASSPLYVQRLLVAYVMAALGNEMGALSEMEYARAEAAAPNFTKLMMTKSPDADIYLEQAQRWQIEVLLRIWPST